MLLSLECRIKVVTRSNTETFKHLIYPLVPVIITDGDPILITSCPTGSVFLIIWNKKLWMASLLLEVIPKLIFSINPRGCICINRIVGIQD